MGYRGKFITEHTAIKLPDAFVRKYSDAYHIDNSLLNISSKRERKDHDDIIEDLRKLLKLFEFVNPCSIWAAIIWEDGRITRFDLSRNYQDEMLPVSLASAFVFGGNGLLDDMQNKSNDAAIARDVIDGLNNRIEQMADGL